MARSNTFNLRLSDEEMERLKFLMTYYGVNGATLFRMLMKRDFDTNLAAPTNLTASRKRKGRKP